MSNDKTDASQHEEKPEEPEPEDDDVSDDLRRALDSMAAFSRNPATQSEVKRTNSYTIVKPRR